MMTTRKWMLGLAALTLAASLMAACGNNDDSGSAVSPSASAPASSPAASGGDGAATGEVKEFTINAANFEFDLQEIKVSKGDTVKITMVNKTGSHGISIPGLGIDIKADEPVEFVADKAGTFDFACSVLCGAGHDNMSGKLIVE